MSSGLWQEHTVHLIPLMIPVVATAAVLLPDIVRGRYHRLVARSDAARRLVQVASGASLAAAAIHLAVTPEHFQESILYGAFFLLVASAQVGCALVLLLRPARLLVGAVVASNAGLVLLWLLTRTVGIPLGPAVGTVESFGLLDLLAVSSELVLLTAGTILLRLPNHAPAQDPADRERQPQQAQGQHAA